MAQAITIQEERSFIKKIRTFYQEKIVDTGISQSAEKVYSTYMDLSAKAANAIINVTGSASEIVLSFVNIDGELGETIAGALTDMLPNIITAAAQLNTKATIGAKNFLEKKVLGIQKEETKTEYIDKENISAMKEKLQETYEQIKEMKAEEIRQSSQNNGTILDAEFREIPIDDGPRMSM